MNVVSPSEWRQARIELMERERELNQKRQELVKARQALPWEKVEKDYLFEGPEGTVSLSDLFGGKSQLIVYHFMYAPDWENPCKGCSFLADNLQGAVLHIRQRDIRTVLVSRAPVEKLEAAKKRFGWTIPWYSSGGSDFNYDYHVSFTPEQLEAGEVEYAYEKTTTDYSDLPGVSVFVKGEDGAVYHSYSVYGDSMMDGMVMADQFVDLTPKGRNEDPDDPTDWVRLPDEYEDRGP